MNAHTLKDSDFHLDGVVPWGRRYGEYAAFFALRGDEGSILDCGAGPSSFAAEAHQQGLDVIALDPLYVCDGEAIRARFEATCAPMMAGLRAARHRFVWSRYASPENIESLRREALSRFLQDYETGRTAGRYIAASLPELPLADQQFDLALVSHFLFLYGDTLSAAFHIAALEELLRVAGEVRVFPLLNLDGGPSSHLPVVIAHFARRHVKAELVPVDFEFQRGATRMLKLWRD